MYEPLRVFIGFDRRQPVAFQVLAHSIAARASKPVAITPLVLSQLPIKRRGLTDFTYSRFLVPYLCDFRGHAVFMDSDMLCLADVWDLLAQAYIERVMQRREASVWVVKGPMRFEWPSLMVFDNERCKALTPEYVEAPQHKLFPMEWAERIGDLPPEWNHLVGYDAPKPAVKLIHYTKGIPCWPQTQACEYAAEWAAEALAAMSTVSFTELMGRSVHVAAG